MEPEALEHQEAIAAGSTWVMHGVQEPSGGFCNCQRHRLEGLQKEASLREDKPRKRSTLP